MTERQDHAAQEQAARLEALETMVAHQDRLLAELNDVITTQWRKIDQLDRQVRRMRETLQSIGPQRDGPEPPPPHY